MVRNKRLKDPIYGYIEIDENIIRTVIDSAGFQRLRNIIQTSYAPLYASAVHNRFVHSLGVYHLGCIVAESILDRKGEYEDVEDVERILHVFKISCLLHDLGHAPFSHTGENYYLEKGQRNQLHQEIVELTEDSILEEEIKHKNYKAAPHELMSVIVALKDYAFLFKNSTERSFFARCILGYPYSNQDDVRHSFLNCVISLLNSAVIDVDKLDYLIRDAYITGFDTVSIDYIRLLQSVRFREIMGRYKIVYTKNAISVIENVVYAHDSERKWIQNHPIVLYEAYLLQKVMEALKNKYENVNLFSYQALTKEGVPILDNYKISLMSDADILFLMKNLNSNDADEYFNRNNRRHPLWKSEAEYKAIFKTGYADNLYDIVEQGLDGLEKYLNYVCKSSEINEKAYQACEVDIAQVQENFSKEPELKDKAQALLTEKRKNLEWLKVFRNFAKEQKIAFDFVIVKASQFNSGFMKNDFGKIMIEFGSLQKNCWFEDVTNTLKAERSERDNFYFVFWRRDEIEQRIDPKRLVVELGKLAMNLAYDES